jgi:predicted CXXCH cytochrome family protein
MKPEIRSMDEPTGQSSEAPGAVCTECGHRFTSSAERLRVADGTAICAQCYKHLFFPERVLRCPE